MERTRHSRVGFRGAALFFAALLAFPVSSSAYDTPLSDTAIREAYFLGQRHDESVTKFLNKYGFFPSPPKIGPYISSVNFLTPFAQVVQLSDRHLSGYNAQQAQLDHKGASETVKITIQIQLTETYSAFIPVSQGSNPAGITLRPPDFWSDFQISFFDGDNQLNPLTLSGHPNYMCSNHGYGCTLTGATIDIVFAASAFGSDSAIVQIDPPEGEQVVAKFNLSSLR
jgi:hypothetical protein